MAAKKSEITTKDVSPVHGTNSIKEPRDQFQVGVTTQENVQNLLAALKQKDTFKDDDGNEINFQGELKEVFIEYCERAYPIIQHMAQSITEVGSFLAEARESLKPQRLFLTWLDVTGFPRRTAYNYLKLIETFKEELPSYSHLGVKKLLAASRLPDGIDFVREYERELCAMSVAEVEQKVKDTKGKKRKGKGGRRPQFEQIGKFRIRISTDETKIVVENLDKHTKAKILSAVKDILSQRK